MYKFSVRRGGSFGGYVLKIRNVLNVRKEGVILKEWVFGIEF